MLKMADIDVRFHLLLNMIQLLYYTEILRNVILRCFSCAVVLGKPNERLFQAYGGSVNEKKRRE